MLLGFKALQILLCVGGLIGGGVLVPILVSTVKPTPKKTAEYFTVDWW